MPKETARILLLTEHADSPASWKCFTNPAVEYRIADVSGRLSRW